ncbi:carbohydrate ABC transporter permease [Glycomyces buryatensis]|uniref:Sugar ABC transporter permease n=1 Tax=Glycomyces buryatensis TaxID=2570927 RepID=A0A4S8Q388_9ACTN|nr:sugar ABC transporter permease [Glycomyces buryatensis]THV36985.1 sugar ABC transporter permease [Glycomyces buryatensis]
MRHSRKLVGAAYAAPVALFVAVFFVAPLLLVGRMSASDWPLLSGDMGVNFPANYESIGDNPLFWPAVGFTLKYTGIVVVILLGLSLLLALIVADGGRRGTGFFRTAYFLPTTLGFASASLLFFGFYSPSIGPLDPLLQWIGLTDEPVSWLGTSGMALFSTVVLVVWKFAGFFMIILLVGLQAIPPDVYEAARLDGASRWQSFLHVTLPLLRPALGLVLILSVTGSLLAFDQFFILTKGGPDNSTVTVVQLIYREAFQRFDLGAAAAISVVVLVALLVFNIAQFRALRRDA